MKRLLIPVLALLVTGCALRIDTPDPSPEPASVAETVRQREALRADVLTEIDLSDAGTIAAHAIAQRDALGGVWEPWPDGDGPTDGYDPEEADIEPPSDLHELAELLARTTPELAADSAQADDASASSLYASIAVSRTADEAWLRAHLSEEVTPTWPDRVVTSLPAVIRSLDEAAYRLETLAARDSADGVESSAKEDATRLRTWAETSAQALGVSGTADDPRDAVYDIDEVDRALLYADLAADLVGAVAQNADRESVIAAAQAAATQAVLLGAEVGPLPGLSGES